MKSRAIQTLIIISLAFLGSSFSSPRIDVGNGIIFFKGTWSEALLKAKAEKKYIFLDVYATWCGPCKQLKRKTFKDKEVGQYFNTNFINVSLDGESEEGLLLANKYQVTSYPTLIIVDFNGIKKTKALGFMEPHILVNFGRRIVP
jgi:thiol:disulfide interchange protein